MDDFFSVLAAAGAGVELEPESLAEALEALDELPSAEVQVELDNVEEVRRDAAELSRRG